MDFRSTLVRRATVIFRNGFGSADRRAAPLSAAVRPVVSTQYARFVPAVLSVFAAPPPFCRFSPKNNFDVNPDFSKTFRVGFFRFKGIDSATSIIHDSVTSYTGRSRQSIDNLIFVFYGLPTSSASACLLALFSRYTQNFERFQKSQN